MIIAFLSTLQVKFSIYLNKRVFITELVQVHGAPLHIPAPAPSRISLHIKIPVLIHRAITGDSFKVLAKKKP